SVVASPRAIDAVTAPRFVESMALICSRVVPPARARSSHVMSALSDGWMPPVPMLKSTTMASCPRFWICSWINLSPTSRSSSMPQTAIATSHLVGQGSRSAKIGQRSARSATLDESRCASKGEGEAADVFVAVGEDDAHLHVVSLDRSDETHRPLRWTAGSGRARAFLQERARGGEGAVPIRRDGGVGTCLAAVELDLRTGRPDRPG